MATTFGLGAEIWSPTGLFLLLFCELKLNKTYKYPILRSQHHLVIDRTWRLLLLGLGAVY